MTPSEGSTIFKLKESLQCQHGGIFDLSLLEESIYVAHSNGFIARYEFVDNVGFKCCESIRVSSVQKTLLTSIDTCQRSNYGPLVVVGDSTGRITAVEGNQDNLKLAKISSKCDITKYADPVWQVKILPQTSDNVDQFIILVAAENSHWYVYKLEFQPERSAFQCLATNRDFEAGVTSICLLPKRVHNIGTETIEVIFGSYDESIRMYEIKMSNNCELVDISSLFKLPLLIEGGGIWRLNCVQKRVLYIAAMYAGTYKINIDFLYGTCRIKPLKIETNETKPSKDEWTPLHYGVDYSPQDSTACIVDYNNNYCIFVDH